MFGDISFIEDYDSQMNDSIDNEELDLSFLEAIESAENLFGINNEYYQSLNSLTPQRQLVPTLKESAFVETVHHAVWNSNSWPKTSKHFPN